MVSLILGIPIDIQGSQNSTMFEDPACVMLAQALRVVNLNHMFRVQGLGLGFNPLPLISPDPDIEYDPYTIIYYNGEYSI